ncbi:MAG: CoA pyrophosphatase [Bacteroidales bacterium]|nr:CoA pyrophosphatase [Bacteroidales bacterium]
MQITKRIALLKSELSRPLPGKNVQMQMAPSLRRPAMKTLPMRYSGVLLLLYPVKNNLFTVFMKRTDYGGLHSGQVSFPGGKQEKEDASLIKTALRETHEEIGLLPGEVDILGNLSVVYIPVSNFKVLPVVGFTAKKPVFTIDPQEVNYLIETPLDFLMNPEIIKTEITTTGDLTVKIPYFDINGHHIWGATAMMLSEFLEVVRRAGIR